MHRALVILPAAAGAWNNYYESDSANAFDAGETRTATINCRYLSVQSIGQTCQRNAAFGLVSEQRRTYTNVHSVCGRRHALCVFV